MKKIIGALCCVLLSVSVFADIQVSDVKVFSGFPWHEVVIGYTITGTTNVPVSVTLSATDLTNNKTYNASCLSGAETTPGRHIMRWNALEDNAKFKSNQVVFTVHIEDPLYCVIDLSGGVDATSYPVMGISTIPDGGWTDEYKTTKLVLRRIEAGSFIMGSDQGNEAHRVTLTKPFYMGVFEVTQKQWSLVMGSDPCSSTTYGKGDNYPVHYVLYGMIRGSSDGAKWPSSSSVDATSFLGKLRAKTGLSFDLPTEAQWEYACRAGTSTIYYWGNSMDGNYAWYTSNSWGKAHPVGTKRPNDWGLYDMSGNVWEWNLDLYNSGLSYGTDPKGPSSGSSRVWRGGCWNYDESYCTSSNRYNTPAYTYYYGFRLVRTLSN